MHPDNHSTQYSYNCCNSRIHKYNMFYLHLKHVSQEASLNNGRNIMQNVQKTKGQSHCVLIVELLWKIQMLYIHTIFNRQKKKTFKEQNQMIYTKLI